MDGFGARRRTAVTVASVLTVLALAPAPAGLAQSAGDRQYADPLVTDGDGQSGQQSPSSPGDGASGGDTPASSPSTPAPTPDTAAGIAGETAASPQATLPRTGAEPLMLAMAGLALTACGTLALATARRRRHARG